MENNTTKQQSAKESEDKLSHEELARIADEVEQEVQAALDELLKNKKIID